MLFLLLACAAGQIDALEGEVQDLEDELDELRDELDALEAEDDTGAPVEDDTGEVQEPEPGEIAMRVNLDTTAGAWLFGVELSEPGEILLWASWDVVADFSESWGTTRCETVTGSTSTLPYYSNTLQVVSEVSWANGAWSCAQVLGPYALPVDGCAVVQPRPVSCE
ncbi:MAG: hypothetical protein H6739_07860 [Alphaproteobacteria bacterium]|nr:hypothetical protein [Alphaproteobacteria bacterium]